MHDTFDRATFLTLPGGRSLDMSFVPECETGAKHSRNSYKNLSIINSKLQFIMLQKLISPAPE